MAILTDATKVARVDNAFGTLVKEYCGDGDTKMAKRVLDSFAELSAESKVRLFDIITKTD